MNSAIQLPRDLVTGRAETQICIANKTHKHARPAALRRAAFLPHLRQLLLVFTKRSVTESAGVAGNMQRVQFDGRLQNKEARNILATSLSY